MRVSKHGAMILILLVVAALACGPAQNIGSVDPTPTLMASPVAESELPAETVDEPSDASGDAETGEASGPTEKYTLKGFNPELLDSFTAVFSIEFAGTGEEGQPVSVTAQGESTGQREPIQLQYIINAVNEGYTSRGPGGTVIATQDGDTSYVEVRSLDDSGLCVSFPTGQANPAEQFVMKPDRFIDENAPSELALVDPNANVNGIPARYYHAEGLSGGELNNATIDVWVAQAADAVVKLELHDEGDIKGFGNGTLDIAYEVTSVNESVTVDVPTDCTGLGG